MTLPVIVQECFAPLREWWFWVAIIPVIVLLYAVDLRLPALPPRLMPSDFNPRSQWKWIECPVDNTVLLKSSGIYTLYFYVDSDRTQEVNCKIIESELER